MGSNSTSDKNFISTICIVQYNKNIQWHVHCTDCQYTGTCDKNYISTMHTAQYNTNVLYNGMYTVQTASTLVVLVLVIIIL